MPDIFGLSISTDYAAGISFALSKKALGDHFIELNGDRAEIKAGQKRVHVLLGQVPNDPKQIREHTLLMAQEFLDDLAVRFQLSYRLLTSDDYIFWQRSGVHHTFEINTTLPFTTGGAANAQIVRSDGSIQLNTPIPPLQAKAFRYYRFASSSEDLFESYRYLYLCLECALYDFFPNQPRQPIGKWLKAALRNAKSADLLDLSAFSVHGSDPIEGFYKAHYKAIRCATFHAQDTPLLPGNPADTTQVSEQLHLLVPEVKKLLQGHFGARFLSAGMTTFMMTRLLELLPVMHLATTPLDNVDASREIQSTLTSVGYYEALPKSQDDVKPDTVEKIAGLIDNAQERFPFDLTPVALEGQRPGFENEWVVTAKTTADALKYRTVQAMTLIPLIDFTAHPNIFVRLFGEGLKGKTLSTHFVVPDDSDIEFRIRVLLRYIQDFPRTSPPISKLLALPAAGRSIV